MHLLRFLYRRIRGWSTVARAAKLVEILLFGGRFREKILLWFIRQHYASVFRRQWIWSSEPPHFFDHRKNGVDFLLGLGRAGVCPLFRGFYATEILREGDRILDIGCGDGFFDRRFFATRCAHVDAIDMEPTAIRTALAHNGAPNITYMVLDAVSQSYPSDSYDVIVCDGVLAHLSPAGASAVLEKARRALGLKGVFVGSESLGFEGADHLQHFESEDDLRALFGLHFERVQLRSFTYRIGASGEDIRREVYWRCSGGLERLLESTWTEASDGQPQAG